MVYLNQNICAYSASTLSVEIHKKEIPMANFSFLRDTTTMASRLFSQEKDRQVFVVPTEHTLVKRSLVLLKRIISASKNASQQKSSVLRLRDALIDAGLPTARVGSNSVEIVFNVARGTPNEDITALINDAKGLLATQEVDQLARNHYLVA